LFGLAGFVITLIVMLQVSSIKHSFKSRARLPEIIEDLEKTGSKLSTQLQDWPLQKNNARLQIKVAASLIQRALPFVSGPARRQITKDQKKLAGAAKEFDNLRYNNPDLVWDLYSDIQSIITSLKQSARDLTWE
jgi:hypothetical protein